MEETNEATLLALSLGLLIPEFRAAGDLLVHGISEISHFTLSVSVQNEPVVGRVHEVNEVKQGKRDLTLLSPVGGVLTSTVPNFSDVFSPAQPSSAKRTSHSASLFIFQVVDNIWHIQSIAPSSKLQLSRPKILGGVVR